MSLGQIQKLGLFLPAFCLMLKIRRRDTKILGDSVVDSERLCFLGEGKKESGVCRVLTGDDGKKTLFYPKDPVDGGELGQLQPCWAGA